MEINLKACLNGDRKAWSDFVAHALPIIRAAVRRTLQEDLPGAADRDDVVQQVFVRLIKDDGRLLRTYQGERAALSTWLTLVARSVAIDQARSSVRSRARHIPDHRTPPEHRESDPPSPPLPLGSTIPLDTLTERQRLVLSLLFERDLSVSDVAIVLGVDQQTVRSTKHKAMLRLREHLTSSPPDTETSHSRGCEAAPNRTATRNESPDQ